MSFEYNCGFNSPFLWIDNNNLSLEQIHNSKVISFDSRGNETRAIWNEKEECYLVFFVQILEPIKIPTLSEINKGDQ